mmetsp:Transcript_43285/g.94283  ORF Transcript_43285/g.94283 Transcript_43285/m.94283 type:complete len:243 (+) Transcript_43285:158-886(+)
MVEIVCESCLLYLLVANLPLYELLFPEGSAPGLLPDQIKQHAAPQSCPSNFLKEGPALAVDAVQEILVATLPELVRKRFVGSLRVHSDVLVATAGMQAQGLCLEFLLVLLLRLHPPEVDAPAGRLAVHDGLHAGDAVGAAPSHHEKRGGFTPAARTRCRCYPFGRADDDGLKELLKPDVVRHAIGVRPERKLWRLLGRCVAVCLPLGGPLHIGIDTRIRCFALTLALANWSGEVRSISVLTG